MFTILCIIGGLVLASPIAAILVGIKLLQSINLSQKDNTTMLHNTNAQNNLVAAITIAMQAHPLDFAIAYAQVNIATEQTITGYSYITRLAKLGNYLARNPHNFTETQLQSIVSFLRQAYDNDSSTFNKTGSIGQHVTTDDQTRAMIMTLGVIAQQAPKPVMAGNVNLNAHLTETPKTAPISNVAQHVAPMPAQSAKNAPIAQSSYPETLLLDNILYTRKQWVKGDNGMKYTQKGIENPNATVSRPISANGLNGLIVNTAYEGQHVTVRLYGTSLANVQAQSDTPKMKTSVQLQNMPIETPNTNSARIDKIENTLNQLLTLMQQNMQ